MPTPRAIGLLRVPTEAQRRTVLAWRTGVDEGGVFLGDLDPDAVFQFACLRAGGREALLRGSPAKLDVSWVYDARMLKAAWDADGAHFLTARRTPSTTAARTAFGVRRRARCKWMRNTYRNYAIFIVCAGLRAKLHVCASSFSPST